MAKHSLQHEEQDASDDRPIAVRRKRRSNSGLGVPAKETRAMHRDDSRNLDTAHPEHPKTPTKSKKRVRFSDPGPDLSPANSSADPSTGLTPYLSRTMITFTAQPVSHGGPRLLAEKPRRRISLPTILANSLPSPSLTPSPTSYLSGEMQFAPLRQVLDDRLKRRLRRNNLSEEINAIDDDRKSSSKLQQEVQELKTELALARQLGQDVAESANGVEVNNERVQELEYELGRLKEEMRERSMTAESSHTTGAIHDTTTPTSSEPDENNENDPTLVNFDGNDVLQETAEAHMSALVAEAATQASLPSPTEIDVFRSARLSLEYLFPGETSLGLNTEDPKLILDVMLDRLRSLKAEKLVAEDALSTTQTLETNLRTQFNAVLQQLDRARTHAEALSTRYSTEKSRADENEMRAQHSEASLFQAMNTVKELEKDVDEKQRSMHKLQDALETYRVEVGKLELLITNMEGNHGTAMNALQDEMDEAVADLECRVASETVGRRAAEKETVERGEKIKQLEGLERELKGAINEKQSIIRDMEREVAMLKEGREREVGVFNVKVGELSSSIAEVNSELARGESERSVLIAQLKEEKAAGMRAVEAVQAEMRTCLEKVNGVREDHARAVQNRGAEVAEHQGLLTPVSATRFKDVEGHVEIRRGKTRGGRRPDSGIGVLEEDEEEEDSMV